jgi:NADH-quinone oxidoreductase subunit E
LRDEHAVLKSTRDEEDQAAAAAAKAAEGSLVVPPSDAAKPTTGAAETNAAITSPSPVKVPSEAEKATSVEPPKHDAVNANKASEEVEKTDKQRSSQDSRPEPAAAFKSPELSRRETPDAGKRASAAAKPSLDDPSRPGGIERPETPDDLKLISGIGPKIEGILHSLGIFTFAQIAAWRKEERDWVDRYLNFKGRIDRDDWVNQAGALASGGVAEYIRVFGKDPR